MFEIERMESEFDYSLVDNNTADFLRSCEYEINGIAEDARVKFGKVLVKAREKLANHHGGVFQKWYESGGLDKHNVYYYMDLYESSRNLENSKRENFLKAPKTVQKKVMQKNTPEEIKEAVHQGEVTTNKQLVEMERKLKERDEKLKQRDSQLESTQRENEILQSKLESAENVEPQVKTIYKEKVPKHVEEQMKDRERELIEAKQSKLMLEEKIKQLQSSSRKDYLTEDEQIGSRRFQAESDVLDLRDNINEFLKDNSINAFREGAIAASSQRTKDVLEEGIEELEAFCRTMRNSLNNRISIN